MKVWTILSCLGLTAAVGVNLKIYFGPTDHLHLQKSSSGSSVAIEVGGRQQDYKLLWQDEHPDRMKVSIEQRRSILFLDRPTDSTFRLLTSLRPQSLPYYRLVKSFFVPPPNPRVVLPGPLKAALKGMPAAVQLLVTKTLESFEKSRLWSLVPEVVDTDLTTKGSGWRKIKGKRNKIKVAISRGNLVMRVWMASDPAFPIIQ
jgi:hypothetical protein